jgi:hypothetical protein
MKNKALITAIRYAERGFFVFPLIPRTRIPFKNFSWRKLATNDPEKVKAAGKIKKYKNANWAVVCRESGLVVLDIDKKNGKNGFKSLPEPLDNFSGISVRTPSGGMHYYFTGQGRQSSSAIAPGLDTPGYVVIPGSMNGGDTPYTQVTDNELQPMPKWLSDFCNEKPVSNSDVPNDNWSLIDQDQTHHIANAVEYLKTQAPEAIEGMGGDHTTYSVACKLRDLGISELKALELMSEYWNNAKATPSWSMGELKRKIANAFKYAQNKTPGIETPESFFPEPTKSTDFIKCAADITLDDIKPREWLLGYRYIKGYVTVTLAPGGVGKSLLMISEGLSIASGKRLTHDKVKKQGPVWFYNTEDPFDELNRRVLSAIKYFNLKKLDINDFYYSSGYERPLKFATYDSRNKIVINEQLIQHTINNIKKRNIKLFIVDPFIECHELNENDNTGIAIVAQIFRRIAAEADCAVSIVHHTSKGNKDARGNMDKSRGASSLVSAARITHTLYPMLEKEAKEYGVDKNKIDWYVRLDKAKSNLAPPSEGYKWYEKHSVLLKVGDKDDTGILKPSNIKKIEIEDADTLISKAVTRLVEPGTEKSVYDIARIIKDTGMVAVSERSIQQKIIMLFSIPLKAKNAVYELTKIPGARKSTVDGVKAYLIK